MKRSWLLLSAGALCMPAGAAQAKDVFVPLVGAFANTNVGAVASQDTLVVSGQVPLRPGPLTHLINFTPTTNAMRATANWNILNRTRLVGVNIDLIDTTTNTVVASDTFVGVSASRLAVSTLDYGSLVPNRKYLFQLTGTQVTAASYTIAAEFGPLP